MKSRDKKWAGQIHHAQSLRAKTDGELDENAPESPKVDRKD